MNSPSNPDWLADLIAEAGDSKPIDAHERNTLLDALALAQIPQPIDGKRHRQILGQALSLSYDRESPHQDDPLVPASAEEQSDAARLRDNLDSDPLVLSLRSAYQPSLPLSGVESSLRKTAVSSNWNHRLGRPRRLTPSAWGVLAAAAAVSLWFVARSGGFMAGTLISQQNTNALALSRSTESLFAKPYALSTNSERIDKIAQVRSRELRNNRYAIWGLP